MRRSARADGTRSTAESQHWKLGRLWRSRSCYRFLTARTALKQRSIRSPLNPEMVKRARELLMRHIDELHVLENSDRDTCTAGTGRPPIPTDWVGIDKGGSIRPNHRSRLVCQETRQRSTIDVEDWAATFAATPYEAFRLQLSLIMTGPRSQIEGDGDVLLLLDILHTSLARVVFVTIDGTVYKLLKAMYGLRDAGASFDRKVLDVINLIGVSRANSAPVLDTGWTRLSGWYAGATTSP